jgi:hypothetical protein
MTAAHDYEALHHLVDRLSPAQVHRLRLLVTADPELSEVAATSEQEAVLSEESPIPAGLLSLIGSVDSGRGDAAERHDDYIRERLRERHPHSS